jgi:hypothetical protein
LLTRCGSSSEAGTSEPCLATRTCQKNASSDPTTPHFRKTTQPQGSTTRSETSQTSAAYPVSSRQSGLGLVARFPLERAHSRHDIKLTFPDVRLSSTIALDDRYSPQLHLLQGCNTLHLIGRPFLACHNLHRFDAKPCTIASRVREKAMSAGAYCPPRS